MKMRVIVADDHDNVVMDYSTSERANLIAPAFGEDGHAIAALAEAIQFLAPSLEQPMPHVYAIGEIPAPEVRKVTALRLVEAVPDPAH